MSNKNLSDAKNAKNDEFYTRRADVDAELWHYREAFEGQAIYLNCDDWNSNFYRYFRTEFSELGLKSLTTTRFARKGRGVLVRYDGEHSVTEAMDGDGDFRSPESVALMAESDVVITNPPFSLFRDFMALLVEHEKRFLVIGPLNAIAYQDIWPLFMAGKVWMGGSDTSRLTFKSRSHDGKLLPSVNNTIWFTNLEVPRRPKALNLSKTYTPEAYPHYDNYDAIDVGRSGDVPLDFDGVMGVPISFMHWFDPEVFELVGVGKASCGWVPDFPYPPHIEIQPDGSERVTNILNEGPALKMAERPANRTCYESGGEYYIRPFIRVLIRWKR